MLCCTNLDILSILFDVFDILFLSESGDLLQLVFARRRVSSVVC